MSNLSQNIFCVFHLTQTKASKNVFNISMLVNVIKNNNVSEKLPFLISKLTAKMPFLLVNRTQNRLTISIRANCKLPSDLTQC